MNVTQGTRITAAWLDVYLCSVAGEQNKAPAAHGRDVTGIVRHVYGSAPGLQTDDGSVVLYVDPDGDCDLPRVTDCSCGGPHVAVKAKHVTGAT